MKYSKNSKQTFINWKALILCFLFAIVVSVIINFSGQMERHVSMPLEIIMPDGVGPTSIVPSNADVVIKGSEKQIYMVKTDKLKLFADFSDVKNQGVATAAVQIDYSDLLDYIDTSEVSIFTKPSIIKIYFE